MTLIKEDACVTHRLDTKGIAAMNAISTMAFSNNNAERTLSRASEAMGLGPNQLTWPRRNIDSFKEAEEQRRQMRQDVVRAARIAGLI